jgi:hypothetical protein
MKTSNGVTPPAYSAILPAFACVFDKVTELVETQTHAAVSRQNLSPCH